MTLRRIATVAVPPGARPGFDHADVYGDRMYVAHTGADRIDVFDCSRRAYLHALRGHPGVAGVLIDAQRDLLLATDRGAAQLSVYRASDESLLGRVGVGKNPNGIALDVRRSRALTFDLGDPPGREPTMTAVDLKTMAVVTRRTLPGRPRWAAYDAAADVVYANISDPAVIVVIDPDRAEIVRSVSVPVAGPHGLNLIDGLLFCAADGKELVVLDPSGVVKARLPLAGVPDVVMNDGDLGRAYVAIGSPGVVQAFDTKALRAVETVATEEGAHTIGWDATRKQLWAFAPRSCAALVFDDTP